MDTQKKKDKDSKKGRIVSTLCALLHSIFFLFFYKKIFPQQETRKMVKNAEEERCTGKKKHLEYLAFSVNRKRKQAQH